MNRPRIFYESHRARTLIDSPAITIKYLSKLLAEQQLRYEIIRRQLETTSHELYLLKKSIKEKEEDNLTVS